MQNFTPPLLFLLHSFAVTAAKQSGDSADCRNTYNGVYNSRKQTAAAKDKGHKVKIQNADKPPVKSADNQQSKTYFIQCVQNIIPFLFKMPLRQYLKTVLTAHAADILQNSLLILCTIKPRINIFVFIRGKYLFYSVKL